MPYHQAFYLAMVYALLFLVLPAASMEEKPGIRNYFKSTDSVKTQTDLMVKEHIPDDKFRHLRMLVLDTFDCVDDPTCGCYGEPNCECDECCRSDKCTRCKESLFPGNKQELNQGDCENCYKNCVCPEFCRDCSNENVIGCDFCVHHCEGRQVPSMQPSISTSPSASHIPSNMPSISVVPSISILLTSVGPDDGTCTVNPDPHFKTFHNINYDYHGEGCDLVLITNQNLDVQIRTEAISSYAIVSTAAVKIGADVLEVNKHGSVWKNNVTVGSYPTSIGGKSVTKTAGSYPKIKVAIDSYQYIEFKYSSSYANYGVALAVVAKASYFGGSKGMCGWWKTSDLIGPDEVIDYTGPYRNQAFGEAWKVDTTYGHPDNLFRIIDANNTCEPGGHAIYRRTLQETDSSACDGSDTSVDTSACDYIKDFYLKKNCKFDVCTTNDTFWAASPPYTHPLIEPPPDNDWYISLTENGISEVTFANGTESVLTMVYDVSSGRMFQVKIFNEDCTTDPEPNDIITTSFERSSVGHWDDVFVNLDIDKAEIQTSSLWKNGTSVGNGTIDFCVKAELILDGTNQSVSFHETQLHVDVSMKTDFNLTVETKRNNATEKEGEADVDYNIAACICNTNGECLAASLQQNSEFNLCITPESNEVEVKIVEVLSLSQNDVKHLAIDGGSKDSLTTVLYPSNYAIVTTRAISMFFAADPPSAITISGAVFLQFRTPSRRLLSRDHVRYLESKYSSFDIKIQLEPSDTAFDTRKQPDAIEDPSDAPTLWGMTFVLAVTFFLVLAMLLFWKKRVTSKVNN